MSKMLIAFHRSVKKTSHPALDAGSTLFSKNKTIHYFRRKKYGQRVVARGDCVFKEPAYYKKFYVIIASSDY